MAHSQPRRSLSNSQLFGIFLVIVALICLAVGGYYGWKFYQEQNTYQKLTDSHIEVKDPFNPKSPWDTLVVDWDKMKQINPDYVGWLHLGTGASYPVLQGKSNQTYLRHNIYHQYALSGSIFMDSSNTDNWMDKNTVVYGHNMRSGKAMFTLNKQYFNTDFYNSHPFFYVHVKDGFFTYIIFDCLHTHDSSFIYNTNIRNESELNQYLEKAKNTSDYWQMNAVDGKDKIVTLSTCTGQINGLEREVIQGKMLYFTRYSDNHHFKGKELTQYLKNTYGEGAVF